LITKLEATDGANEQKLRGVLARMTQKYKYDDNLTGQVFFSLANYFADHQHDFNIQVIRRDGPRFVKRALGELKSFLPNSCLSDRTPGYDRNSEVTSSSYSESAYLLAVKAFLLLKAAGRPTEPDKAENQNASSTRAPTNPPRQSNPVKTNNSADIAAKRSSHGPSNSLKRKLENPEQSGLASLVYEAKLPTSCTKAKKKGSPGSKPKSRNGTAEYKSKK
jgi:hypothetical protein